MKSASARKRAAARGSKDLLLTLMATGRAGGALLVQIHRCLGACTQLSHEIVAGYPRRNRLWNLHALSFCSRPSCGHTLLDTLGCAPHQLTPVDTDSAVCMLHAAALCRHEGE